MLSNKVPTGAKISFVLIGLLFVFAWLAGVAQIATGSGVLSDLLLVIGAFAVGLGMGTILNYLGD